MQFSTIRLATTADKDLLHSTQCAAFEQDPMVQWHWPTTEQRQEGLSGFFGVFADHSIQHECAYCTNDVAGLAFWHPPNSTPDESKLDNIFQRTTSGQTYVEVGQVFEQLEGFKPDQPHWYLSIIAVAPDCQGKGYGAALMMRTLQKCDRDHLPAYLVSPNPRNLTLYERHGFQVVGQAQSGSSPVVTAMLRPAQ